MLDKLRAARKAFLTNFLRIHYSQFGEDIILGELLGREKTDGVYVDVGCYHPKKFSNTYSLYKRGWRGVNIDAEAQKIELFKIARPKDHNVVAAVSDVVGKASLHPGGLGSTVGESDPTDRNAVSVTTRTLNDILAESPYAGRQIDVLSIDVEGMDARVLRSLDIDAYRPKIILVEDHHLSIDQILETETYKILNNAGYVLRSWAFYTLIFVLPGADILKQREHA
ncbi:MAG: FkbM family methyltransferase [Acidobacteria bacterium]|nr:FkbM family methyltransferase [Acidobacteriota bacterium]